jgi:hypothetical protein
VSRGGPPVWGLGRSLVLNRWKNFFKQMLNMHGVHNVKQMDIHMAEPLVPEPSPVKVEIAIEIWVLISFWPNRSKKEAKHHVLRYTNVLVLYGIRRNCRSNGRNLLLYQFIKWVIKWTVIIIKESPSYQLPTKCYPTFFWQS